MREGRGGGEIFQAYLRSQRMPKRNYTNFSGNYSGASDEAWKRYFKSIENYKHMSAW